MATQAEGGVSSGYHHRILLALLILSWAISWPVIKIGVATVPPIWYACFRYAIAASCLFAFIAVRREVAFPPRTDWPLVAVSGILQMAAYSALTALALTDPSSRPGFRARLLHPDLGRPARGLAVARTRVAHGCVRGRTWTAAAFWLSRRPPFMPSERNRSSPTPCSWLLPPPGQSRSSSFARIGSRQARLRSPRGKWPAPRAFSFPLRSLSRARRSRFQQMARHRLSMWL